MWLGRASVVGRLAGERASCSEMARNCEGCRAGRQRDRRGSAQGRSLSDPTYYSLRIRPYRFWCKHWGLVDAGNRFAENVQPPASFGRQDGFRRKGLLQLQKFDNDDKRNYVDEWHLPSYIRETEDSCYYHTKPHNLYQPKMARAAAHL